MKTTSKTNCTILLNFVASNEVELYCIKCTNSRKNIEKKRDDMMEKFKINRNGLKTKDKKMPNPIITTSYFSK